MAMSVQAHLVGVDVSKPELVIYDGSQQALRTLANDPQSIAQWLDTLPPGPVCLAVEATNTYHLELIQQAHERAHTVYVIDGLRLNRYRESIGGRAKTDASDARLLWRYLDRERGDLRPWSPPSKGYVAIQQLLRRRATLVKAKVALTQSLREFAELKTPAKALVKQLEHIDTLIQRRLRQLARQAGWSDQVERCQAIEGVGPLNAMALTMTFHRGHFRSADAFIAFLGLDVRVRESGSYRGRRKLTKQGDPELRRLLHLAAMQACRSDSWKAFYQRHIARGLSKIQALVSLARKLARVAFALLKNNSVYQPKGTQMACQTT
jgi:transposase